MVSSILTMARLDWPVPDFSTLSRRQKTTEVQISNRRAPGPLNLLVDSTGIKFLGDGEYHFSPLMSWTTADPDQVSNVGTTRPTPSEGKGRTFKSCRVHHFSLSSAADPSEIGQNHHSNGWRLGTQ